jgi:phenylalanyl-tRNA synthetase alpha subunit
LFVRSSIWQGLILSKALKAPKDAEDESCQIALGNLRSDVITLRNEALAKDKILLSLVESLKSSEAKLSAQAEVHKAEVQELEKELAKATENFNVELTKHEISDIEHARVQKNVEELHQVKEECYNVATECVKNLKNSFSKVGAFCYRAEFHRW